MDRWYGGWRVVPRIRLIALGALLLGGALLVSGCNITSQYCGKDETTDYLFACEIPSPHAGIHPSTLTPKVGQVVTFEAAADHENAVDSGLYENNWTFVGPGGVRSTISIGQASEAFSQPGQVVVELGTRRPTANGGGPSVHSSVTLTVEPASSAAVQAPITQGGQPPTTAPSAAFTVTPSVGKFGSDVTFDASSSTGTGPLTYSWDFKGDGSWTAPSPSPTATTVYPPPGFGSSAEYDVGLIVSGPGGTSEVHHPFEVSFDGFTPMALRAQPVASASRSQHTRSHARGVTLRATGQVTDVGHLIRSSDHLLISRLRATGALKLSGAGASSKALKRFRYSRLALDLAVRAQTHEPTGSVTGMAVLRFPHAGGVACLGVNGAIDVSHTADGELRPIAGAITVLGGSGAASRLRISGPIAMAPVSSGVVRIAGTGRVTLAKRGHRMSSACSRMAREG